MNRIQPLGAILGIALAGAHPAAWSQAFPAKPVRVVLPSVGGAPNDVYMRLIAPRFAELLGQPLVVENRPGASGLIAAEAVIRSAPDGYTLLFGSNSNLCVTPALHKDVRYDPVKGITPITNAMRTVAAAIVGNPSGPSSTMRGLIEHAKRNPDKVTYGSDGIASTWHVVGEAINVYAGTRMTHVPYKATTPAYQDVMTGRLDITFGGLQGILPLAKAGKLNVIAVLFTGTQRFAGLPEVPAIAELVPGFEAPPPVWGIIGPAGIPGPVVARLHGEFVKMGAEPQASGWMEKNGFAPVGSSPEELVAAISGCIDITRRISASVGGIRGE